MSPEASQLHKHNKDSRTTAARHGNNCRCLSQQKEMRTATARHEAPAARHKKTITYACKVTSMRSKTTASRWKMSKNSAATTLVLILCLIQFGGLAGAGGVGFFFPPQAACDWGSVQGFTAWSHLCLFVSEAQTLRLADPVYGTPFVQTYACTEHNVTCSPHETLRYVRAAEVRTHNCTLYTASCVSTFPRLLGESREENVCAF